ncbi:hypothetical protein [Calycomorphotria hydatis]|uniref:Uncharacterized protein n=1 Tax=Calycomorphotria hydatis TaxID=2528027 RepID=A0A517T4E7_9PLAN|nr:hypothetical protein [Calycomorphotria hydatis]QDT63243.1 hypothetical protein V22_04620 [Calycomorphotria hydatis]
MEYYVDCECSSYVTVELFQAGTSVECEDCGREVKIPSSVKLKEMAGDKYPNASPLERAEIAIENGERPFDGQCQRCRKVAAEVVQPANFRFLQERYFDHDGGVDMSYKGPVSLVAGAPTEEHWKTLAIPLMFCKQCYDDFTLDRTSSARASAPTTLLHLVGWAALLLLMICLCIFLPFVGIPVAFFLFARLVQWKTRKKGDPVLLNFVKKLRWVGAVVSREDEYTLTLGESRPLKTD